jgi:hypothetical membrane protein
MGSKKFLVGLFGPLTTILLILLDIKMSSYFSWYSNSLSSLGIHKYYFLFDSAVMIGGLSVCAFAIMLYKKLAVKFLSMGIIIIGSISLFLIGIFNENYGNLHLGIAIVYFIATPVGIIIFSFYRIRHYISYYGFFSGFTSLGTIIFGILVLLGYINIKIGLSVTEMAEAVLLASWSGLLGLYLSNHEAK